MAGDPNLEITGNILLTLQDNGADLIQLGIPYSHPLADGPIIQLSALQMMILKDFKTSSSDSTDSEDDDVEDLFTYPIESN